MDILKRFITMILYISLCMPLAQAQSAPEKQREARAANTIAQDVLIIIHQEQVRFTARKSVAEMQLQVFDQAGQRVYDSGTVTEPELNWVLRQANGEKVKSGLYAYTLSVKEKGAETVRVRRGHLIVDRVKERDGQTDRLWITSQDDSGAGTEMAAASNDGATTAGPSIIGESEVIKAEDKAQPDGEGEPKSGSEKSGSEAKEAGMALSTVDGRMTIQGSDDPLLEIDHTGGSGNPAIWFKQDGAPKAYLWWDQFNDRLNLGTPTTNPILTMQNNGTVGIGTYFPFPSTRLHVVGSGSGAAVTGATTDGIGVVGVAGPNGLAGLFDGDVRVIGSVLPAARGSFDLGKDGLYWRFLHVTHVFQVSDARLKKGVANLRYGLRELMQLRPVTYEWKDNSHGQQQLGLIAQETEQIIPEAVARSKDPAKPLAINYTALMPVVIKAIQQQQGDLTTLKNENEALQQRNTTLQRQNADLEARLVALEQMVQQVVGAAAGSGGRNQAPAASSVSQGEASLQKQQRERAQR